MLSNAYFEYFLAKFRFDTAENEPAKNLQNFAKICLNFARACGVAGGARAGRRRGGGRPGGEEPGRARRPEALRRVRAELAPDLL